MSPEPMRLAITGTTGRLGRALADRLGRLHSVEELPRCRFDLADPAAMARALDRLDCDVFLHPAAITSVDACEDDPAAADRVNAEAPAEIAAWCARRGCRMLHFSTDYVFSGDDPRPRNEDDLPAPLGRYGASKLAAERAVLSFPGCAVWRVSWIFGPERGAFVDQVFARALAGEPLAAVADKWSLPAFTADLADWVEAWLAAGSAWPPLLHACNRGEPVTWHGLAERVVEFLVASGRVSPRSVRALRLAEMEAFRAPRPVHTALDTRALARCLGRPPRPWREALDLHLAGLAREAMDFPAENSGRP